MIRSLRALAALAGAAFALAGCGGGSGGTSPLPATGGGGSTTTASAPISIAPSYLGFVNPSSAPQQFTVTSTSGNVAAPVLDSASCGGIATISGGGGTLPQTYTVTPVASSPGGGCTLVLVSGTNVATLQVGVSPPAGGAGYTGPTSLTASPSALAFSAPGAAAQSFTVVASGGGPGTVTLDAQACAGIATVSGSGGPAPQTFSVSPVGNGGCELVVVDGIAGTIVPVSVGGTVAAAVTVDPGTLSFTGPSAAPQNVTVGAQGQVGQVTLNQASCAGIASFTIPNGSLPQTGTVTPLGSGTCSVVFTPSNGQGATLTIAVH